MYRGHGSSDVSCGLYCQSFGVVILLQMSSENAPICLFWTLHMWSWTSDALLLTRLRSKSAVKVFSSVANCLFFSRFLDWWNICHSCSQSHSSPCASPLMRRPGQQITEPTHSHQWARQSTQRSLKEKEWKYIVSSYSKHTCSPLIPLRNDLCSLRQQLVLSTHANIDSIYCMCVCAIKLVVVLWNHIAAESWFLHYMAVCAFLSHCKYLYDMFGPWLSYTNYFCSYINRHFQIDCSHGILNDK